MTSAAPASSPGDPSGVRSLRLATRRSPLAIWQADHVAELLRGRHPGLTVELVGISTEGDRRTDVPLSEIGGKGVFATEVQAALLDGRADVAVHSAKDLPAVTTDALTLAAVPRRGDPRDALVGSTLAALRPGAVVATGSARRRAALATARPDLRFAELRGNMATRVDKAARFDAIVVAAVALERLGWSDRVDEILDVDVCIPQVGQGALGLECRRDDDVTTGLLAALEDPASRRALDTERAFLAELGGDCSLPAGAHATCTGSGPIHLRGLLATAVHPSTADPGTGDPLTTGDEEMPVVAVLAEGGEDPAALGAGLARRLREQLGGGAG